MEIVIFIVILGILFDYTNGFHDTATIVSTIIGPGVLRPVSAITIAIIFNTIGATQISGIAKTITTGLIQPHMTTEVMILSAIVGAIIWNLITWIFGIPSSSSYALIGGLLGAALYHAGLKTVVWGGVLFKVVIPMVLAPIVGFLIAYFIMHILLKIFQNKIDAKRDKVFGRIQIVSSAILSLAHGFNDAQKSMALITLGLFSAGYLTTLKIPFWVIMACAATMGLGTASGGMRIIKTMGFKITKMTPAQGFAAQLSASGVIITAAFLGMPLSSTNMVVGSITGVGAAKARAAVQWNTIKKIVIAWVLTLPGSALIAALTYLILSYFI